uniref:Uncharacterized protein n=1 Tax=Anguilla anguilla TaxID=7936 RepID=A0A0E9X3J2_ANGAN
MRGRKLPSLSWERSLSLRMQLYTNTHCDKLTFAYVCYTFKKKICRKIVSMIRAFHRHCYHYFFFVSLNR